VTSRSDFTNGMTGPKRREMKVKKKEFGGNCDPKLKKVLKDFHRRSSIKLTLFKKEHNM